MGEKGTNVNELGVGLCCRMSAEYHLVITLLA